MKKSIIFETEQKLFYVKEGLNLRFNPYNIVGFSSLKSPTSDVFHESFKCLFINKN